MDANGANCKEWSLGPQAAEVTDMTSIVDSPIPADLAESVGRVSALLTAAPLGVAFSGGVDSSVLLALAVRTLGPDQVVAILGVSPSLGTDDRRAAHKVAAYIGVRLVEVQTREGEAEAYRVNGPDRCFHCKTELFSRIEQDVAPVMGWLPWPTARTLTMGGGRIDLVLARLSITRCCGHSRTRD